MNALAAGELRAAAEGGNRATSAAPTRANDHFGVDFTSSTHHQGVAAICAFRPTGVDVKRSLLIATLPAAVGGNADLVGQSQ
jgi:hypothetical protein